MSKITDNKSTEPIYTLAVASRLSGTPAHSIRQYIDKGLLIPFKTETNRHLFSEMDILRLKKIRVALNEMGLNIAGIKTLYALVPCWYLKPCSPEERVNCEAYYSDTVPCWLASQKSEKCMNEECRTCEVYKHPDKYQSLKDLIRLVTK